MIKALMHRDLGSVLKAGNSKTLRAQHLSRVRARGESLTSGFVFSPLKLKDFRTHENGRLVATGENRKTRENSTHALNTY